MPLELEGLAQTLGHVGDIGQVLTTTRDLARRPHLGKMFDVFDAYLRHLVSIQARRGFRSKPNIQTVKVVTNSPTGVACCCNMAYGLAP